MGERELRGVVGRGARESMTSVGSSGAWRGISAGGMLSMSDGRVRVWYEHVSSTPSRTIPYPTYSSEQYTEQENKRAKETNMLQKTPL